MNTSDYGMKLIEELANYTRFLMNRVGKNNDTMFKIAEIVAQPHPESEKKKKKTKKQ